VHEPHPVKARRAAGWRDPHPASTQTSSAVWSGDGKFVGVIESLDGSWQQWIVRVDAGVPSLGVKLAPYVGSTQALQAFSQ
jgi:hypothetical protein